VVVQKDSSSGSQTVPQKKSKKKLVKKKRVKKRLVAPKGGSRSWKCAMGRNRMTERGVRLHARGGEDSYNAGTPQEDSLKRQTGRKLRKQLARAPRHSGGDGGKEATRCTHHGGEKNRSS